MRILGDLFSLIVLGHLADSEESDWSAAPLRSALASSVYDRLFCCWGSLMHTSLSQHNKILNTM